MGDQEGHEIKINRASSFSLYNPDSVDLSRRDILDEIPIAPPNSVQRCASLTSSSPAAAGLKCYIDAASLKAANLAASKIIPSLDKTDEIVKETCEFPRRDSNFNAAMASLKTPTPGSKDNEFNDSDFMSDEKILDLLKANPNLDMAEIAEVEGTIDGNQPVIYVDAEDEIYDEEVTIVPPILKEYLAKVTASVMSNPDFKKQFLTRLQEEELNAELHKLSSASINQNLLMVNNMNSTRTRNSSVSSNQSFNPMSDAASTCEYDSESGDSLGSLRNERPAFSRFEESLKRLDNTTEESSPQDKRRSVSVSGAPNRFRFSRVERSRLDESEENPAPFSRKTSLAFPYDKKTIDDGADRKVSMARKTSLAFPTRSAKKEEVAEKKASVARKTSLAFDIGSAGGAGKSLPGLRQQYRPSQKKPMRSSGDFFSRNHGGVAKQVKRQEINLMAPISF